MKDYPKNTEQWAQEAFQALLPAWDQLLHNNPFPSEKQKEELVEFATEIACANRDITDSTFIDHAHYYVQDMFKSDMKSRDIDEKTNFSQCFVLAYLDAHLSLSMITQQEVDKAIKLLSEDFDLSYEGKQQSNVFTVDFKGKLKE